MSETATLARPKKQAKGQEPFRKAIMEYDAKSLCMKMALANSKGSGWLVLAGYRIKVDTVRLNLFIQSDRKCVVCGKTADKFVLEHLDRTNPSRVDLNLYGKRDDGSDLLFTKDHILPKSLSGSEDLYNMQVMCTDCNGGKGHVIRKEDLREIFWQIKTHRASLIAIAGAWLRWKLKTRKPVFVKWHRSRKAGRRLTAGRKYYSELHRILERYGLADPGRREAFARGHVPESKNGKKAHKWEFYRLDGVVGSFRDRLHQVEFTFEDGSRAEIELAGTINQEIKSLQDRHRGRGFWKRKPGAESD